MIIQTLLVVLIAASPAPSRALVQQRPPWPIIKNFGGAIPKNESAWVTPDDYPSQLLKKGQQGNVVVAFDITAKGRAENCVVEASSGVSAFDRVPCPRIEQRARFQPASDENGAPKATKARYSVVFWIPN